METGEDFWLRWYNGSSWQTVATYASGSSFTNGSFYTATVTLTPAQVNFASNSRIRFQCDASANADRIYIDAVTVTGISGSLIEDGPIVATIEELGAPEKPEIEVDESLEQFDVDVEAVDGTLGVFPNPAERILNIRSEAPMQHIRVLSATGQVVRNIAVDNDQHTLDIADLKPGVYYLMVDVNGEMKPQRFVKQ